MEELEKMGAFYVGRQLSPDGSPPDQPLLLDARSFTTHAVCVGMTGSGKTGLCLSLLEEAAIDGIPVIAIDPKGDVGNLLLQFPTLSPQEFAPWVDPEQARRSNLTVDALAEETALKWQNGLRESGQSAERVARLAAAADFSIYTPGSRAGKPLAVLGDLRPPKAEPESEAWRDRVTSVSASLLSLIGESDLAQSREHALCSALIDATWRSGQGVTLESLIAGVQNPPFEKLGFLTLESFYSKADRFALALRFNNLAANIGFASWLEGAPLDIPSLLFTPAGKPRVSILSIAHLSDTERMFFVTLFLSEMVAWMRCQPGTSSLRAILYMDEIFGFFPPVANPSSKLPMLTLLKQARAFGIGVVLATQNPVDLDYKGLSNAGTWFIGRLQTERDRMRMLDGLESSAVGQGHAFNRSGLDSLIAGLKPRQFLLHNQAHSPIVFESRFALCYLRGPLTLEQIQMLNPDPEAKEPVPVSATSVPTGSVAGVPALAGGGIRPVIDPSIAEFFIDGSAVTSGAYSPTILGSAKIHFASSKANVDEWSAVALAASPVAGEPDWQNARKISRDLALGKQAAPGATFAALPQEMTLAKNYAQWTKKFTQWMLETQAIRVWFCPSLKTYSKIGASEQEFRYQLTDLLRGQRDRQLAELEKRFAPKLSALREKLRKAQARVSDEKSQSTAQTTDAVLSVGASVLGAFLGRKTLSVSNATRVRSAARSASRALEQRGDIAQAEQNVTQVQQAIAELEAEFDQKRGELAQLDAQVAISPIEIKPKKSDIQIATVGLLWWR